MENRKRLLFRSVMAFHIPAFAKDSVAKESKQHFRPVPSVGDAVVSSGDIRGQAQ